VDEPCPSANCRPCAPACCCRTGATPTQPTWRTQPLSLCGTTYNANRRQANADPGRLSDAETTRSSALLTSGTQAPVCQARNRSRLERCYELSLLGPFLAQPTIAA